MLVPRSWFFDLCDLLSSLVALPQKVNRSNGFPGCAGVAFVSPEGLDCDRVVSEAVSWFSYRLLRHGPLCERTGLNKS